MQTDRKRRILVKDAHGEKYSTTAWVVWSSNRLNQRRQFATDGVLFFYQPTTRDPFIIVNVADMPIAAQDALKTEKGE